MKMPARYWGSLARNRSTVPRMEVPVAMPSAQSHARAVGCRSQLMTGKMGAMSSRTTSTMMGQDSSAAISSGNQLRDFMVSIEGYASDALTPEVSDGGGLAQPMWGKGGAKHGL